MASTNATKIAVVNDAFRRCDPNVLGQRLVTAGIIHLLKRNQLGADEIVGIVSDFNEFTEDDDPHGEHDFGSFTYLGESCFWKIDAYDVDYSVGSEDPTDLSKTRRVLTIVLAEEC